MTVDTITGVRKIHHWVGVNRVYYEGLCQGTKVLVGVPDARGVSIINPVPYDLEIATGVLSPQALEDMRSFREQYEAVYQSRS